MFTWKGEMMCGRVHTIDKQDTREVNWVKEWAKEHWNQTEPFISHCRTFFTFSFSHFFFMYDLRACICAPSLFCCLIFNRKKNRVVQFHLNVIPYAQLLHALHFSVAFLSSFLFFFSFRNCAVLRVYVCSVLLGAIQQPLWIPYYE